MQKSLKKNIFDLLCVFVKSHKSFFHSLTIFYFFLFFVRFCFFFFGNIFFRSFLFYCLCLIVFVFVLVCCFYFLVFVFFLDFCLFRYCLFVTLFPSYLIVCSMVLFVCQCACWCFYITSRWYWGKHGVLYILNKSPWKIIMIK